MNTIVKILLFTLISIGIIYISRRSLQNPRSHGFYRFFVFESVTALFLLVINHWFINPLSWNQLISWSLLAVSLIPLVFGLHHLVKYGKPDKQRDSEPNLMAFEKTTTLVTTGIFGYIRHPLYCSLLLLTWGLFFKAPGWWTAVLTVISTGSLILTAKMDEMECLRYFGSDYQEYIKRTKRFIPFLF